MSNNHTDPSIHHKLIPLFRNDNADWRFASDLRSVVNIEDPMRNRALAQFNQYFQRAILFEIVSYHPLPHGWLKTLQVEIEQPGQPTMRSASTIVDVDLGRGRDGFYHYGLRTEALPPCSLDPKGTFRLKTAVSGHEWSIQIAKRFHRLG